MFRAIPFLILVLTLGAVEPPKDMANLQEKRAKHEASMSLARQVIRDCVRAHVFEHVDKARSISMSTLPCPRTLDLMIYDESGGLIFPSLSLQQSLMPHYALLSCESPLAALNWAELQLRTAGEDYARIFAPHADSMEVMDESEERRLEMAERLALTRDQYSGLVRGEAMVESVEEWKAATRRIRKSSGIEAKGSWDIRDDFGSLGAISGTYMLLVLDSSFSRFRQHSYYFENPGFLADGMSEFKIFPESDDAFNAAIWQQENREVGIEWSEFRIGNKTVFDIKYKFYAKEGGEFLTGWRRVAAHGIVDIVKCLAIRVSSNRMSYREIQDIGFPNRKEIKASPIRVKAIER